MLVSSINYLLVVPFRGERTRVPDLDLSAEFAYPLVDERAHPGYCSATLEDIAVEFELAAAPNAAVHRYRFPQSGEYGVAIDVTNGGLAPARARSRPDRAAIQVRDGKAVSGLFVFNGVTWYFCVVAAGAETPVLWRGAGADVREDPAIGRLELAAAECAASRAGATFRFRNTTVGELIVGLSLAGEDEAAEHAIRAAESGFDRVHRDARRSWESHLGRFRIDGTSDAERTRLYTALYHSLLKPVRCEGSNHLWRNGPPLYADFATMWDQYKTQIPLVFTLCPEHILPVVESLNAVSEGIGAFPAAILFADDFDSFSNQSRLLPAILIKDAFDRLYPNRAAVPDDAASPDRDFWLRLTKRMADAVEAEAQRVRPGEETNGYSHLLDISFAACCVVEIANRLDGAAGADRVSKYLDLWRSAFDPDTGMMKSCTYYEGTHIHYSFRLPHAMAERIRLAGGSERFLGLLDGYFGLIRHRSNSSVDRRGMRIGSAAWHSGGSTD